MDMNLFGRHNTYPPEVIYYLIFFSIFFFLSFFFFLRFWPPQGIWSSWARNQIQATVMPQATVVTQAETVAMLDPWPTVPGWGSNLHPCAPEMLLGPLHHSRNSSIFFLTFRHFRFSCNPFYWFFYGLCLWSCQEKPSPDWKQISSYYFQYLISILCYFLMLNGLVFLI